VPKNRQGKLSVSVSAGIPVGVSSFPPWYSGNAGEGRSTRDGAVEPRGKVGPDVKEMVSGSEPAVLGATVTWLEAQAVGCRPGGTGFGSAEQLSRQTVLTRWGN